MPEDGFDASVLKELTEDNRIGIGCEARVRTPNPWFRARCDASSTTSHWSGREDSNLHHRRPKPACCTLNTTSRLVPTEGFEPALTAF